MFLPLRDDLWFKIGFVKIPVCVVGLMWFYAEEKPRQLNCMVNFCRFEVIPNSYAVTMSMPSLTGDASSTLL
jgi:hypothetical protein